MRRIKAEPHYMKKLLGKSADAVHPVTDQCWNVTCKQQSVTVFV